ncbi:MAM and LDL-receptor class A domain-containing protein 1-like [Dermacentor silvarum]|uniref:MAM and LDL-receptor class A domain-containing protein 1-like n=1 Tax=Dermacentor silvarum TaxID=543639 RepID=UPI002100B8B9|nr:MAM and LDL-receptor class A domain-containing protein 1-like [Dermacentor silvarum]
MIYTGLCDRAGVRRRRETGRSVCTVRAPRIGKLRMPARLPRGVIPTLVVLWVHVSTISADTCTFENGPCSKWVSSNCSEGACFQVHKVSDMKHGPTVDHTLHLDEGSCYYATAGSVDDGSRTAMLAYKTTGPLCFTAWYHQSGTDHPPAVFSVENDNGVCTDFYATRRDAAGRWQRVRYSEKHNGEVQIRVRYHIRDVFERGTLALDDLTAESRECPDEPKDGSCDFDWGETCGYNFGGKNRTWKHSLRPGELPFRDYSTGGMLGGMAYLEADGRPLQESLTSPTLPGRPDVQCLRFHYYVSGSEQTTGKLLTTISSPGTANQPIWERSKEGIIRDAWTAVDVAFKHTLDFKITFTCILLPNEFVRKPACAIDAIELDDCAGTRAPKDRKCDFEDGWCAWKNNNTSNNDLAWMLGGENLKTTLLRPSHDHTYGNRTGSYLFLSNFERNTGDQADLIGEDLFTFGSMTQCVEFWYDINGDKETSLEVLVINPTGKTHKAKPLWKQKGADRSTWQMGRVAATRYSRLIFRGAVGPSLEPAYIALDDISVSENDRCETLPQGAGQSDADDLVSCDFETGDLCHWTSESRVAPVWKFGPPASSSLGPLQAPEDKGGMIHLTGSSLANNSGRALLSSGAVETQTEAACFSFWYHMFGGDGVQLELYLKKSVRSAGAMWQTYMLFSHSDRTTADRWYNVRRTVLLDAQNNKFVFSLTAIRENPNAAVVALGPLDFTQGPCDVLTDSKGYCDFEADLCGWESSTVWKRGVKLFSNDDPAHHVRSGPVNSAYVLRAAMPSHTEKVATVTSPEFPGQSEPHCLEFWYSQTGTSDAKLQAEILVQQESKVIWTKPSFSKGDWMLARVQFVQDQSFKVVFRATLPANTLVALSLDNVAVRPEPCVHPLECDFTEGLCGYVNRFEGDFRWLIGAGRLENPQMQPKAPIPQGAYSSYAYLDLTTGTATNTATVKSHKVTVVGLLSPVFNVFDNQTTLVIQYYRNGPDIVTANLSVSCYDDGKPGKVETQLSLDMAEVSEWSTLNVSPKQGANCQLSVQVTRGDGTDGAMAIGAIRVQSATVQEPDTESANHCTFEDGTMCGWKTDGGSLTWTLNEPAKKVPDYPRFDRTLRAYKGRFIFAENKNVSKETAVLKSPVLDVNATGGACFSFWHFAVHHNFGNISVISGKQELFRTVTRNGHRWEHELADFTMPTEGFQLEIRASIERGIVSLDDLKVTAGPCPPRDFCSWENGSSCKFFSSPGNVAQWRRRRASAIGVPDHTLNSLEGYYLFLNTTALKSHHPMSRVFLSSRKPTEATCVTFWWRGKGARSQLNVYRYTKETAFRDPLLSMRTDNEGNCWTARSVTVSATTSWALVFEVVAPAGEKRQSGVMVDDVEYSDGECPLYNLCTFEDECLPWVIPAKGGESRFEVERAGSFSKLSKDHTTSTEAGYYLLYRSPGIKGNRTSLELREPSRYLYSCVSMWYFLPSLPNGVSLRLHSESIANGTNTWKQKRFRFSRARQVPIEAIAGSNADGFLAIDDLLIDDTECNDESQSGSAEFQCGDGKTVPRDRVCDFVADCDDRADERSCGQCDFSEGACGWNLDDARNRGTTAWQVVPIGLVPKSPPNGADYRRDGNYLLVYANSTRTTQHGRASIESPKVRNTGQLCTLFFWYNYDKAGTNLDVDLYMTVAGYTMPVWTLGALGKSSPEGIWNGAAVEIGRQPREVSFYFSTNQYPQARALFAVDAIHYSTCALPSKAGNCTESQFHCDNDVCVDSYERCNYADDCGDNSDEKECGDYRLGCNFDSSFCDWLPQAPSPAKATGWELGTPSSLLSRGPSRDHTTGTQEGKFIILHSTLSQKNATIIGPTLHNAKFCAMTFFYTVQGESEPQLSLNVRTTKDGSWKRVWSQPHPTQFWHFVPDTVFFEEKEPYQVAFIGEHGRSRKPGYIAIDDITFSESCEIYHEALPETPTPSPPSFTCKVNEYQCGDSEQCIPVAQVCDFKNDCANNADEAQCGACDDFSTSLCGLENEEPNGRFGWKRTTARDAKQKKLYPSTDSMFNPDGAYAAYSLLNADVPVPSSAILMVTPRLGQIAHSCVVNFYAYVADDASSILTFGVLPPSAVGNQSSGVVELSELRDNRYKGKWVEVTVKVGNWDAGARFFYRAGSVGVSVDRPKYINCHPDAQSEGSELTKQVSCDFSNPKDCGWFPERQATDVDWVLYTGGIGLPRPMWQPPFVLAPSGAFMIAKSKFPVIKKAHLVSIRMSPTPDIGRCFTFWYNMWHPNSGELHVLQRVVNDSTRLLWRRVGPQGKEWHLGNVQLHSYESHQLVIEAVLKPNIPGIIAIDLFTLKDGPCDTGKECTFESGTCGWQLRNWELTKGNSAALPLDDHSMRAPSGSFAVAKSPGGRMLSPPGWYDATQDRCLRFWFFLSGTVAETLNVTRVLDQNSEVSLWSQTATNAPLKIWYSAAVNLTSHQGDVVTVFEGVASGDPGTAVAVDDIGLSEAPCPPPGSCSFEEDMCNWYNNKGLAYAQWYRHKGPTVSFLSRLEKDHTRGTSDGYYLLLDSEDQAAIQRGILQSQTLALGPVVCFQLYYHMQKGTKAWLNVTFVEPSGSLSGDHTTVYSTSSIDWTLLYVERDDLPDIFSVIITATAGKFAGNVAIDDIYVRSGKCGSTSQVTTVPRTSTARSTTSSVVPEQPFTEETTVSPITDGPTNPSTEAELTTATTATPGPLSTEPSLECSRGEFSCRDGTTCIPALLTCDGVPDCPNGLDEICSMKSTNICSEDKFYCPTKYPDTCLPRSLLCDGHEDCFGSADESLCGVCPDSYCRHGGTCSWTQNKRSPVCNCSGSYAGARCQYSSNVTEGDNDAVKASGSSGPIVAGILIVMAIGLISTVIAVIVFRRKRATQGSQTLLHSAAYDVSREETEFLG